MLNRCFQCTRILAVMVALSSSVTNLARADTIAFTGTPTVTNHDPGNPVNLGTEFTANSAISVTGLGFYFESGVSTSEEVSLWTSTGILLASVVVPAVPGPSGYEFASIAPVSLTSGQQYVVSTQTGNDGWGYGNPPVSNPAVTFNTSVYVYGSSSAFPTQTFYGATESYYGPNFEFAMPAVPEPSSFVLLGLGGLGLIFAAQRRRQQTIAV